MRQRLVGSLFGTLLVVGLLCCVAGECDINCEWTSWFAWDCSHCCGRTPGQQYAFRQRGICCHNTTDPNQCILQCGVNPRLAQMPRPCGTICPCPTTAAMSTTTAGTTRLTTLTHARVRVSTVPGNENGPTPNSETPEGNIDHTSAANGQSVVSTTRKPTTTAQTKSSAASTTRKPTTTAQTKSSAASTTRKPITTAQTRSSAASTTKKPTTTAQTKSSTASTTRKPITTTQTKSSSASTTRKAAATAQTKSSSASTTRKPVTTAQTKSSSASTTRKAAATVQTKSYSAFTTKKPSITAQAKSSSASTTIKPTTTAQVWQSSSSKKREPTTSNLFVQSSASVSQHPGSISTPNLPSGTSQPALSSIVNVGATSMGKGPGSSTPYGSGLFTQRPNGQAVLGIPLGLEVPTLAATTGLNGSLGSEVLMPASIGTILTSGISTLNHVISSAMAHTGSNETMDCRKECSGKVAWDDCLLECFLRPCTTMLTFVSPCLFVLGVIVGSCITCIVRSLLNKKKNGDKNSVSPFE